MSTPPSAFSTTPVAPFVAVSAVAGALILLWAFFSSTLLGFLFGWLLKFFLRARGLHATFDSINFAPLSGTMVVKGIEFTNQDLSIRIVDGYLRMRWWLQTVKRSLDDTNSCRIELELNGMDIQLYNNTPRYSQLKRALHKLKKKDAPADAAEGQEDNGADDEEVDLTELVPVDKWQPSFWTLVSPVLKVVSHKGSIMVGNPRLEPLLVASYHSMAVRVTTEPATHPKLDYNKKRLRVEFTDLNCKLIQHSLYSMNNQPSGTDTSQATAQTSKPKRPTGFQKFLRGLNFNFLSTDKLADPSYHQLSVDDDNDDAKGQAPDKPDHFGHKAWKKASKQQDIFDAAPPMFAVESLVVDYHADSPGPIPDTTSKKDAAKDAAMETDDSGELFDETSDEKLPPPQWGATIRASKGALNFGPAENRLRAILQGFFFPPLPPTGVVPRVRQYDYFQLDFKLQDNSVIRMPTLFQPNRPLDDSGPLSAPQREFLEVGSAALSFVYNIPANNKLLNKMQIVVDADDDFKVHGKRDSFDSSRLSDSNMQEMESATEDKNPKFTLSTSTHSEPFAFISNIAVDVTIDTPDDLTKTTRWLIDTTMSESEIFFLRDHADLLARIGQDFALPPSQFAPKTHRESIAAFRPTQYEIALQLTHSVAVHLNLNERNIVDDLSSLKKNTFYTITADKIVFDLAVPLLRYQAARLPITFTATSNDVAIIANHCQQSTLRQLYEPSHPDEKSNFLFAGYLRLSGGYNYATGANLILPVFQDLPPEVLVDYLDMNVEAEEVKMKAIGAHMSLLMRFLENYTGDFSKTSRSHPFPHGDTTNAPPVAYKDKERFPLPFGEPLRRTDVNISVRLKHPTVSLPLNLYNDQIAAVAKARELQVDVRTGRDFTVIISVPPATLYLPACGTTIVTKPMATINSVSVELLFKQATIDRPKDDGSFRLVDVTYRKAIKVHVGDIHLAAEPIHVIRALDGVQQLFYHLFNRDNRTDTLPYPKPVEEKLAHNTVFVAIERANAKIWGPRGLIQVQLPDGLKMAQDTLFTPTHGDYLRLRVPRAKVSILSPSVIHAKSKTLSSVHVQESEDWLETAAINIPKVILRVVDTLNDESKSRHVEQLAFLRKADADRMALPYIWTEDPEKIWGDPSERDWLRNFFDPSAAESEDHSIVHRIFDKIPPASVAPPPAAPTFHPPKPASSVPSLLRRSTPSRKAFTRPDGSTLSVSDRSNPIRPSSGLSTKSIGIRSSTRGFTRSRKNSVAAPKPNADEDDDDDSEFYSAHSDSDVSVLTESDVEDVAAPSSVQLPQTKVIFEDDEPEEPAPPPVPPTGTVFPVALLLDHYAYYPFGHHFSTETMQMGEFERTQAADVRLTRDPFGSPDSVPSWESSNTSMVVDKPPPRKRFESRVHNKATSSVSGQLNTLESRRMSLAPQPHSRQHSSSMSPSSPSPHQRSKSQNPTESADKSTEPTSNEEWESNEVGTIAVLLDRPIDAHISPQCCLVVADALDHVLHERMMVQTILDRLQLGLVSQLVVSPATTGSLTFKALFLQLAGVRLNMLQSHAGLVPTCFITSLDVGQVIFTMKMSTEVIHPAVYANVRYELPATVKDVRSRDMSLTLRTATLLIEQLDEEYAAKLQKPAATDATTPTDGTKTPPMPKDTSRVIFRATLTDPIQFINRFVAPSYLATREDATFVHAGRVVGAAHEAMGAFAASVARAWIPSAQILTASLSALKDRARLPHLILFEILSQQRDVDCKTNPYDAFGTESEANRTAWMLIYVARLRMIAAAGRYNADQSLLLGHMPHKLISVDFLTQPDAEPLASLKLHHLPPLLAATTELDYFLHDILVKDPDLLGAHFLMDDLYLKRAQTTRQRFNVHIQGASMRLPTSPQVSEKEDQEFRSAVILLPLDVTALTKKSVRLPVDARSGHPRATTGAPPPASSHRKNATGSEDLAVSSSDVIGSMSATATAASVMRVLAPVVVTETEFLVNSKGVKIHLTPKVLEVGDGGARSWRAAAPFAKQFEMKAPQSSAGPAVKLALLSQMVEVSPEIWDITSREKQSISGHLVSDAFSIRACSSYGAVGLDIPETTLTMSSLPPSSHNHRPASHTVILKLPVLKFAAAVERRKQMAPTQAELLGAPITLELHHLTACVMFTPSGISIVDVGGTKREQRAGRPVNNSLRSRAMSRAAPALMKEGLLYDALDVVVRMESFTVPFRLPHPVYTQSFLNEWYIRADPANAPAPTSSVRSSAASAPAPSVASSKLNLPLKTNAPQAPVEVIELDPKKRKRARGVTMVKKELPVEEEAQEPPFPFLSRRVRATFHAHLENITLVMTQLQDLPVKYEVPEVVILSRHEEREHALHVSVKSHSVSFEPRKGQVSVDKENFDFASTNKTLFELPSWSIEATLRQYLMTGAELRESRAKGSTSPLRSDLKGSFTLHYVKNVLKANIIKNILVFQATMRRELDSFLAVLQEANKNKKSQSVNNLPEDADDKKPDEKKKETFEMLRIFSHVRWRFDMDWKGLEVQVESPHATIMLYTGHLRGFATNLKVDTESSTSSSSSSASPSPPPAESSDKPSKPKKSKNKTPVEDADTSHAASSKVASPNPFEWQISLDMITAVLCPPSTNAKLYNKHTDQTQTEKLDLWAGLSTNLCAQSYNDNKFEFKYSNRATQESPFKTVWILLSNTHILVQPWVGEKALLMWLFFSEYHSSLVRRKPASALEVQRPQTLEIKVPKKTESTASTNGETGSTMMLEGTNATLFVQVSVVAVLVPCNSLKGASKRVPLSLASDPRFNMNTALLLRLESFTFSGSTRSTHTQSFYRLNPTLVRPKRTQLLANAVVKGLVAGFDCLDYERIVLSLEDDAIYKPSSMNHASISSADCRFVFVKEAKLLPSSPRSPGESGGSHYAPSSLVGAVELVTAGLVFKFNAQLYSHVSILFKCVELGQSQFVHIMDELNQQQQKALQPQAPPQVRKLAPASRARLGSSTLAPLLRSNSVSGIAPFSSSSKPSSQQSTFQLDITLTTKAGALEFYSTTSVNKVDVSNASIRPKTPPRNKKEHEISESHNDPTESVGSTSTHMKAGSFRMPPAPGAAPTQPANYTLLVTVPLPQVQVSFSKAYTSLSSSIPRSPVSPEAEKRAAPKRNSNLITVTINSINCVISPDLAIFYHELLTQISVVKQVLKDGDDEELEDALDGNSLPNLFSASRVTVPDSSLSGSAFVIEPSSSTTSVPSPAPTTPAPIDKEEEWTVHFHLKPTSLVLSSTPYSETTCALKTDDLIIMYQSAYVETPKPNASTDSATVTGLQRSVLVDFDSISLKFEHPHLEKDSILASLEILSIRLHGSHTNMGATTEAPPSLSTSSASIPATSNPLTLLVSIKSGTGFFSIRHLQETLLFLKVWQQGIYLSQYSDFFGGQGVSESGEEDVALESSTGGDTQKTDDKRSSESSGHQTGDVGVLGLLLEESSVLLNVEIHSLQFTSDLGPSLASVNCGIDYVIGSVSAPGRTRIDPLGEIFDLVLQAGPVRVAFTGTLAGALDLPSIGVHGRRILAHPPFRETSQPHSRTSTPPSKAHKKKHTSHDNKPSLVGRNIWSADMAPINVNLNYSLSPVLIIHTGDVSVAAMDSWRKKDMDEEDPSILREEAQWEAVVNVNASLGPVDMSISSETIALPTNVAKRLIDSVRKSADKAQTTLRSMDQLLVVRRDLHKLRNKAGVGMHPIERLQQLRAMKPGSKLGFKGGGSFLSLGLRKDDAHRASVHKPTPGPLLPSTSQIKRRLPIGDVKFVGSALSVRMYSFSLRDPSWFDLMLNSFQIALNQQVQQVDLGNDDVEPDIHAPGAQSLSGSTSSVRRGSADLTAIASSGHDSSSESSVFNTISRELSVVIGGAKLVKITESRVGLVSADAEQGDQLAESIFVIPATTLVQLSTQEEDSLELEVYFMTQFKGAIRVSIKLGLYTELTDTVSSYNRVIESSKNVLVIPTRTPAARSDSIKSGSTVLRTSRRKGASVSHAHAASSAKDGIPQPASSHITTQESKKPSKFAITSKPAAPGATVVGDKSPRKTAEPEELNPAKNEERVFIVKKFDFNPSVDVLGDFTPKIATVLGWLGIQDGEKTIPKAVHNATDILEATLTQVDLASRLIARQRQRLKDVQKPTVQK